MKTKQSKWCKHCGTDVNLIKSNLKKNKDGTARQSYICNPCNSKQKKEWYHRHQKSKILVQEANMRSYAKRFGYKLTKI